MLRPRSRIPTICLGLLTAFLWIGCQSSSTFYLSPDGDDSNPGTKSRPFATIAAAQEAIKNVRSSNPERQSEFIVYLSGGTYQLKDPIAFGLEDSGSNTTTFKAAGDSVPVISGGRVISEWTLDEISGLWKAQLPKVNNQSWTFRELFINDRRAMRARYPNTGYLRIAQSGSDRRTNFYFRPGDFPIPQNIKQTELVLLHDWSITRITLDSINYNTNQVFAKDSIGARPLPFFNLDHWEDDPRYFLENDRTFIDADYEWFLNETANILYLKLPENVHPDSQKIVAPYLGNLMTITGTEEAPVRNLTFEGLSFNYFSWLLPNQRYAGIQACHHDDPGADGGWSTIPAAVEVQFAENVHFRQCHFSHLGGSGLRLGRATRNCVVEEVIFQDISGNGIMIGEGQHRLINGSPWWKQKPAEVALGNSVVNCTINSIGKQFYGGVGIWCGLTANTLITDNEIFELPYSGISVGWMWNPDTTPCQNNQIINNHIHHIMQTLSDGGGIYMLGRQPNSKIVGNRIHDVDINAGRAESNGMFIDEGSTDMVIAGNLIYNIAKSPLRFHRAGHNLIKGNILISPDSIPFIRYNNTPEENIETVDEKHIIANPAGNSLALDRLVSEWKKTSRTE